MSDRPKSIAVVDDDESLCRALSRLLRASSYVVKTHASAEDFLADPAQAKVDFIVLDVQLGGLSGIELRDRLAQLGPVPPIAFITAYDGPEMRSLAWKQSCVAYLRKPFPGERLLEVIRTTLAHDRRGCDV